MAFRLCTKFLQGRTYAAQAASKKIEKVGLAPENLKKTNLANGTLVVTLENCSPVSKFGAFIEAGSRFETSDNLGITHILRNCAGLTTKNHSTFAIIRNIDYLGGNLSASNTRENMIYNLQCSRDKNDNLISYFLETVFKPNFYHWEISDNLYRVKVDLERFNIDPLSQLFYGLHKAAFKGGLSNSLFCASFNVENIKRENLFKYVENNYLTNNSTFVGLGIDHEEFVKIIEKNNLFNSGSDSRKKNSEYIGGNARIDFDSDSVFVTVASEGASLANRKELYCLKLISSLLGNEVKVPYSFGSGELMNALAKQAKQPFRVFSLNINYTDSGLFGFTIISSPKEIHTLIKTSIQTIQDTCKNLNEAGLLKAKQRLLANQYLKFEDQTYLIDYLGTNSKFLANNECDFNEENVINSISVQDIQSIIKKVFKSKLTVASVGKLDNVPYAQNLL